MDSASTQFDDQNVSASSLPKDSQEGECDIEMEALMSRDADAYQDTESLLPTGINKSQSGGSSWQGFLNRADAISYAADATWRWTKGPEPPRSFQILPVWQTEIVWRPHYILIWICICAFLFSVALGLSVSECQIPGYGQPVRLSCISNFWQTVPYAIGDIEVNYQSLVIGGTTNNTTLKQVYRGDSFICGAAIHAGVINNHLGGSGIINLVGAQEDFHSTLSNGISSISFAPSFPLSFHFENIDAEDKASFSLCQDPRWILLAISVLYTIPISIFTISPAIFFGSTFIFGYFCVALAVDAPEPSNYLKVVSLGFKGFLPASFVGYVIYVFCVKRTLHGLAAPLEKAFLWLGSFWVGALSNMTLEKLPIQRLTLHDLKAEPGAIISLVIILLIIVAIAMLQIRTMRLEGRLRMYLRWYASVAILLVILLSIPGMNLRLHHYIIALILLPGTAVQTRPSLIFQGLLVGLFINGIARWGFDSIIQVPTDLVKIDVSQPFPVITIPQIMGDTISISLRDFSTKHEAISVVINDVERYRSHPGNIDDFFSWTRNVHETATYFRFGYIEDVEVGVHAVGRYSKAATWLANGTWLSAEI